MMVHIARSRLILLALAVALVSPATSSAQLAGLKKKMKDKITGDTATAANTSSADADAKARQDSWQRPAAITSAALDGFAKAMKAENAERAKYIASAPPSNALAKWNAYQVAKANCASELVKDDSTLARLQRTMMAQASAGRAENIKLFTDSMQAVGLARQARSQRCNALPRPQFTEDDFKAVHAEEDREESMAAAAGGFTPLVYSRLKERVIAYVLMPTGWKPSGYSPDELRAIDARRAVLTPLLGSDFNNSGQRNSPGS
jgi:hypothetical protein